MKDLMTVIGFTKKDAVKRKSFIISMIIILAIIVIGFNVPNVLNSVFGDEEEKSKILVIDSDNVFEDTLISLEKEESNYEYTMMKEELSEEEIKSKLENEEYDSVVRFKDENGKITIDYMVENLMYGQETAPQSLIQEFQTQYTAKKIMDAGLTEEQLQSMFTQFEVNVVQTAENTASGNIFVMLMLSMVLFFAIYYCAFQVSSSITTEKTSKIMETLVTSTKPSTIVLGKTIGIGLVGLLQIVVIAGTAIISAKAFLPAGTLENIFDMSNMTLNLGLITLLYFILGYFTYALLYALTGSMVSKPEDIQSANGPIAILVVIGFYLAYFSMMNPASNINQFAALMPFSSPFCMPLRVLMGITTTGELIASIAILAVTIFIIAKISIKVYSSAILNYGTKMNFKEIIKMCKNKND